MHRPLTSTPALLHPFPLQAQPCQQQYAAAWPCGMGMQPWRQLLQDSQVRQQRTDQKPQSAPGLRLMGLVAAAARLCSCGWYSSLLQLSQRLSCVAAEWTHQVHLHMHTLQWQHSLRHKAWGLCVLLLLLRSSLLPPPSWRGHRAVCQEPPCAGGCGHRLLARHDTAGQLMREHGALVAVAGALPGIMRMQARILSHTSAATHNHEPRLSPGCQAQLRRQQPSPQGRPVLDHHMCHAFLSALGACPHPIRSWSPA